MTSHHRNVVFVAVERLPRTIVSTVGATNVTRICRTERLRLMPDTSPTPVDIDALEQMLSKCVKSEDDWLRTFAAITELRNRRSTRASIGPDSERVRYKIGDAIDRFVADRHPDDLNLHDPDTVKVLSRAIRDALLPGPDDIVVSREALTTRLLSSDPHELEIANQILCAALSQPHPAQEQQ
jgi:hypothetical protein